MKRQAGICHRSAATKCEHALRAYDDALDYIAGLRDVDKRLQLLNMTFPLGVEDSKLEKLLKIPLYPYQKEGALFAVRAGRALIGDEMGLGKTIQAIAVTEILARYFGVSKVLVVCPASLKYQWQSEIKRFAGRVSLGYQRQSSQTSHTVPAGRFLQNYQL